MRDIDEKLNDIIFRYGLDSDYPNYRKKVMADSYIRNFMLGIKEMNKKVLCLAAKKEDVAYFSFLDKHVGSNMDFRLFSRKKGVEGIDFESYDEVYAISMRYAYIVHLCSMKGILCHSVYLDMKRQGLCFETECYRICEPFYEDFTAEFSGEKYVEGIQIEHFSLKQYLGFSCSAEERFFYLRNIYFLSLCMKDFLNASKYLSLITELEIDNRSKAAYIESWREIQELLRQVQAALKCRKQRDIIVNWMDAIGYEECGNMPFLNACRRRGINFTNAFTVMPFTHETYKTIFKGTLPLSDYFNTEDISDGKLIKDIEKRGYEFKLVSGYMDWFGASYESDVWHNCGACCSEILWDMLSCLMKAEKPMLIVGHLLIEGHDPNLYSDMMSQDFVSTKDRWHGARQQLDKQMEYYADFFPNEAIAIYMSDHGLESGILARTHTNLIITGKKVKHKNIEDMFSYVRFSDLILQLAQTGGRSMKKILQMIMYVWNIWICITEN